MSFRMPSAVFCLLIGTTLCGEAKKHSPQNPQTKSVPILATETPAPCPVRGSTLTDFVNQDSKRPYSVSPLIEYLTNPSCEVESDVIRKEAFDAGFQISRKLNAPFQDLAPRFLSLDPNTRKQAEQIVIENLPTNFDQAQLPAAELLVLVGQIGVLTSEGGRTALSRYILRELSVAELREPSSISTLEVRGLELASRLVELGTTSPLILNKIGEGIEEMSFAAQASTLGRILNAVSVAAQSENRLIPVYFVTLEAFHRGVLRGIQYFSTEDRTKISKTSILALGGTISLLNDLPTVPGMFDQNFQALLKDPTSSKAFLKEIWTEILKVLITIEGQNALARTVGDSLNEEVVLMSPTARDPLFEAAKRYPSIAFALQNVLLSAWKKLMRESLVGPQKVEGVKTLKNTLFLPYVAKVFEFPAHSVQPLWISELTRFDLLNERLIEDEFPELALSELQNSKLGENHPSNFSMASLAQQFAAGWALGSVYVPLLNEWVQKQENQTRNEVPPSILSTDPVK